MRTLTTLAMLAAMWINMRAQLFIEGRQVAFDQESHLWLATVPEECFGRDSKLTVSLGEGWSRLLINGEEVTDGYTFDHITAQSMYPAMVSTGQGSVLAGIIMFTFLPIAELQDDGTLNDYVDTRLLLSDPQRSTTDSYDTQARWRGNITNGSNKHKHNYRLKLKRNASLLGLRKDDNWILDAGQIDVFRLRNRIAADLWNDLATPPYYADKEPEACTAAHGRVVELFVANRYWGVYNLSENIDRKQMRLTKQTEYNGEVHGALWKSNGYGISAMNWNDDVPPTDNKSVYWDTFEAKYPDLQDSDTIDWQTLHDAIWFVAHSSNSEFRRHIGSYFDIPVLVDFYIFTNILLALDNNAKNMVWAVYDKQTDRRLTPAVWDLDCTAGQRWLERYNPRFSSPNYPLSTGTKLCERLLQLNACNFCQEVYQRYWLLRDGCCATDSLVRRYTDAYDMLTQSGAALREQNRWSGDSDLDGAVIDFDDEIAYIKQWFKSRMAFLDRQMKPQNFLSNINAVGRHDDTSVYNLQGQKMPDTQQSLRPGVYIRNGRKFIVR